LYTVTQEERDAYKDNGSVKRGYISIIPLSDEEPIILNEYDLKDFTILDDIYTPNEGIIGSVIAKQLSLNLFKPSEIDLTNREVSVYVGVDVIENDETVTKYIPYGNFIIQKPENEQVTSRTSFEAFDYMVKFNLPFEDTLTYPCTIKDVLNAICEQCGVELATTSFANENFVVENNQFVNGESCRDVLKAIAQISGSFARIGRDNKLYLGFLNNQIIEQFNTTDYMSDLKVNNTYGAVNRLILRMSQVEGENVVREDEDAIARDGLKELTIADNPFTYTQEKREMVIDQIWQQVRGLRYTDFETKVVPRPYMDVGDGVLFVKPDGTSFYSYLLSHEISYNGGLGGSMSATADTETETKYAFLPAMQNRLKHTELIVDKANQTITSIVEEQDDINTRITQLQASIGNIQADVKTIGGNNKQENSVGAFGTDEYEQSEIGEILAYENNYIKTTTESGRAIMISAGKWFKFKSTNLIIGETYTLSFKYSNDELNTCKISLINNNEIELVNTTEKVELQHFEYTFTALAEYVELYVETGSYSMTITDYYLQSGGTASSWQPAPGEIRGTSVSIYYNGIKVTSENSEIITKINNLGFSVENSDGKILITVNKDEAVLSDTNVTGVLRQSRWKRQVIEIESKEILVEVYE